MKKACNLVAVTVTPFAGAFRPHWEQLARQTEMLAQSEADAIFPCASTGEYVRMERGDKLRILREVSRQNAGRKALVAGACDASEEGAAVYLEAAKAAGYDACVVCPPYYYGLSQEEVFRFYQKVCQAAEGMPVIAYHVPFFTTGIEPETLRRMLELPGLAGIKDSSANMKRIAHTCSMAKRERPGFRVYTGTDDCLLPALCAGCSGSMTALGASLPGHIRGIYDAFAQGNLALAMVLQEQLLPLLWEADRLPFPLGYKLLAKAAGWPAGVIAGEQEPGGQEALARIRQRLAEIADIHVNHKKE